MLTNMDSELEDKIKKIVHKKVPCCVETLVIMAISKENNMYLVEYYIPSLDRHEQTKLIRISEVELLNELN